MNSRTILGICLFLGLVGCLHAQEIDSVNVDKQLASDSTSLKGTFASGLVLPIPGGNNFIAAGTDTAAGFFFSAAIGRKNLLWELYYGRFSGDVTEPSIVGAIETIGFNHFLLKLGYFKQYDDSWYHLIPKIGVGLSSYTNTIGNARFFDNGFTVQVGLDLLFKLGRFFAVSIGLDQRWDFLQIETAIELEDNFRATKFLIPSFGMRLLLF